MARIAQARNFALHRNCSSLHCALGSRLLGWLARGFARAILDFAPVAGGAVKPSDCWRCCLLGSSLPRAVADFVGSRSGRGRRRRCHGDDRAHGRQIGRQPGNVVKENSAPAHRVVTGNPLKDQRIRSQTPASLIPPAPAERRIGRGRAARAVAASIGRAGRDKDKPRAWCRA